MIEKRKLSKTMKYFLRSLPLVGVSGSVLLPLQRTGQQFMVLIVLVWLQIYLVLEIFMAGK